MKKFLCLSLVLAFAVSCGSSKKEYQVIEDRDIKKEYKVIDVMNNIVQPPSWIIEPTSVDKEKVRKNFRYFSAESEAPSQRLAVRSAEARAKARVAQEIAQFIKNSYSEATQGGEDEDVSEYMQEQLATETQAFLVGAAPYKRYWEKRKYLESLGAEEDKTSYKAYALVRMSKKDVEKAVKSAKRRLLDNIKQPEVKEKTNKALKDVDKAFSKLDAPVDVKDIEMDDE